MSVHLHGVIPNLPMHEIEKQLLEHFAESLLGNKSTVSAQSSDLAAKGYDVGMLVEIIAGYNALPIAERTYGFENDFVSVGDKNKFGLLIRRR